MQYIEIECPSNVQRTTQAAPTPAASARARTGTYDPGAEPSCELVCEPAELVDLALVAAADAARTVDVSEPEYRIEVVDVTPKAPPETEAEHEPVF